MRYKCLVVDLDGTLFYGHGKTLFDLTESNVKGLKEAQKNGLIIAIASGRMISYGQKVVRDFGLSPKVVAGFNGAVISYEDEPLDCIAMSKKDVIAILEELDKIDDIAYLQIQTLDGQRVFSDPKSEVADRYRSNAASDGLSIVSDRPIKDWIKDDDAPIGKLSVNVADASKTLDLQAKLKEAWPHLNVARSSDRLLEMMDDSADKGRLIDFIVRRLGLDYNDIACIGDNDNDMAMVKKCGYSFGMASGDKEILAQVDQVVEDVGCAIIYILESEETL